MKSFEEYQKTDHNACSVSFKAGYDAAKEEMSYDVHTCHHKCTRLMCVQRREIERLKSKLAIAIEALEKYSEVSRVRVTKCNDGSQWRQTDEYTAKDALAQIKDVKDPEVEANRQWIKNQLTERKDVK